MPVNKPKLINVPEIDDNAKQAFLSRVEGKIADRLSAVIDNYNNMFGTNDTISFSVMQYNRLKGEIDTVILPIVRSDKTVNESALTKLEGALKECNKIILNPNPENKATAVQVRFNQSGMDKDAPAAPASPSEKAPRKPSIVNTLRGVFTPAASSKQNEPIREPFGKITQTPSGSSVSSGESLGSGPAVPPNKPTKEESEAATRRASQPADPTKPPKPHPRNSN